MGKHINLPKGAKIGTTRKKTINLRGQKRTMTWEKVKPYGKNKNLHWKIKSNKKTI